MISIEDALEIQWQQYWDIMKKADVFRDCPELVEMGLKQALKNAYESGFKTSRMLSVLNASADEGETRD